MRLTMKQSPLVRELVKRQIASGSDFSRIGVKTPRIGKNFKMAGLKLPSVKT